MVVLELATADVVEHWNLKHSILNEDPQPLGQQLKAPIVRGEPNQSCQKRLIREFIFLILSLPQI